MKRTTRNMVSLKCLSLVGIIMLTATSSNGSYPLSAYEVLFGWKELDYQWLSPYTRERLLQTKEFIPENNIITGVKVFGDRVFITVPRWRLGIPSTLNVVKITSNDSRTTSSPPLVPYPSWEMQQVGDCNAFQYVQSMEIDEFGRMWIIDTGRINTFSTEPVNKCPAKLILMDLDKDEILSKYEFPPEVVSPTTNFLNDLVVGCSKKDKCWVYITDSKDAKLVVYNLEENKSWFVHHKTMDSDPMATNFPILGENYIVNATIDGIALSPKYSMHDRVYYTPLSGFGLYSVRTSVLQVASNEATLSDRDVTVHIKRSSQSDGLFMDSRGMLFYGRLRNNSVVFVDTRIPGGFGKEIHLVANDVDLQWPDTFGSDDKGYLYLTTNRWQRYSTNSLDFTEVNFRISRVFTGSRSYMYLG